MKTLFVDAGVSHNGNYGGTQDGRIAVFSEDVLLVDEGIGNRTNNEGELLAIKRAIELTEGPAQIYSDSKLAVNLVNRVWKTKKSHLRRLLDEITLPEGVTLHWVPRDSNKAGMYLEAVHGT